MLSMKHTGQVSVQSFCHKGFSLMEILVVVVLIAIIFSFSLPAINDSLAASKLTASGDQMVALLSEAQQTVSTEGVALEVQFLKHLPKDDPAGDARYRSVILLRRYEKGQPSPEASAVGQPLDAAMTLVVGSVVNLPSGYVLSELPQASTLMANAVQSSSGSADSGGATQTEAPTQIKILRGGKLEVYSFPESVESRAGFVLRSEGTNLNSSQKWFVTLVKETDEKSGREPDEWKNFYCIQVNPVTGGVTSYRP